MQSHWIGLQDIPPGGREFTLDDQEIWTGPVREFGLACAIRTPLTATVFLLPQEGGVLARGRVRGEVILPCDRCAEDALVTVDHAFESFEPFPPFEGEEEDETVLDVDREVVRFSPGSQSVEVNLAALVWEEFSLALPVKPLCDEACPGLCPECGARRGHASCTCTPEDGDPRLAPLRNLTIKR